MEYLLNTPGENPSFSLAFEKVFFFKFKVNLEIRFNEDELKNSGVYLNFSLIKFILKVGVEESVVNASRITYRYGSAVYI
jgi:hypothetical protein